MTPRNKRMCQFPAGTCSLHWKVRYGYDLEMKIFSEILNSDWLRKSSTPYHTPKNTSGSGVDLTILWISHIILFYISILHRYCSWWKLAPDANLYRTALAYNYVYCGIVHSSIGDLSRSMSTKFVVKLKNIFWLSQDNFSHTGTILFFTPKRRAIILFP